MDLGSIMLAIVLLTTPVQEPNTDQAYQVHRPILQEVAVEMEILDPREVRYILARPEDFQSDMMLLRRRYAELRNAPRVGDSLRFPEREAVNEMLSFNRSYRQYIDTRQSVETKKYWEYNAILEETEALYQVWDTVCDARCEYYYVTVRRQALVKLKERIGDANYYSGQLPPYVPIWRFEAIP